MIGDVLTVAWKEWRELLQFGGSLRGGRFSLLILVAVFGVFLPFQAGAEWVESPATVFYWGWVPLMLVGSAVADSFAGERERLAAVRRERRRVEREHASGFAPARAPVRVLALARGMMGPDLRPAHRLDTGTSGVVAFACHAASGLKACPWTISRPASSSST